MTQYSDLNQRIFYNINLQEADAAFPKIKIHLHNVRDKKILLFCPDDNSGKYYQSRKAWKSLLPPCKSCQCINLLLSKLQVNYRGQQLEASCYHLYEFPKYPIFNENDLQLLATLPLRYHETPAATSMPNRSFSTEVKQVQCTALETGRRHKLDLTIALHFKYNLEPATSPYLPPGNLLQELTYKNEKYYKTLMSYIIDLECSESPETDSCLPPSPSTLSLYVDNRVRVINMCFQPPAHFTVEM